MLGRFCLYLNVFPPPWDVQVKFSKVVTIMIDGSGDEKLIKVRIDQARLNKLRLLAIMCTIGRLAWVPVYFNECHSRPLQIISIATSDFEKEKRQEHLARLSGGVAGLKVYSSSYRFSSKLICCPFFYRIT